MYDCYTLGMEPLKLREPLQSALRPLFFMEHQFCSAVVIGKNTNCITHAVSLGLKGEMMVHINEQVALGCMRNNENTSHDLSYPPDQVVENIVKYISSNTEQGNSHWSQVTFCVILRLLESFFISMASFIIALFFLRYSHVTASNFSYLFFMMLIFLSVETVFALTGLSEFDGYSNWSAMVFGGAMVGAIMGLFVATFCGTAEYVLSAVIAGLVIVCAIHLVSFAMLKTAYHSGKLMRYVAVISENEIERKRIADALNKRDDVEIVHIGATTPSQQLKRAYFNGALDEIILGAETVPDDILSDMAITVVRIATCQSKPTLIRRLFQNRRKPQSPWNLPVEILAVPPIQGGRYAVKRMIDIGGALLALLLLSPILVLTVIAVWKTSPGPIFFMQERVGYRGKMFRMFKFRTMRTEVCNPTASQLTQRDDPRLTCIGGLLRSTSIDELPQILNVLRGEMSLVGPRPHALGAKAGEKLYDDLIPNFYARYCMPPGITGLAQVSGLRGNTDTEQSLINRYLADIHYIKSWHPQLDIVIMFKTVVHLIKGENAY